jgi:glycine/D-amino acid oxidase-like deaminating enzyme
VTGYRQLRAELGAAPWLADVGCLQFESEPSGHDALLVHVQRLRDHNFPVSILTREQVAEIEPDLIVPESVEEIFFYADESYVDGPQLVAELVRRSVAHGLELRTHDAVVDIEVGEGQVRSVVLKSGERIEADAIICCCGRWTDDVLRLAGVGFSVMTDDSPGAPTPGLIVTTKPVEHRLRRLVIANGVHVRPAAGGRLIVWDDGVDQELQQDPTRSGTESDNAERLAEAAIAVGRPYITSLADAEVESATVCIRSLPRDGLPAIGWLPGVSGLYLIVSHAAVSLSPAAGALATTEILDHTERPELEAFRPDRFASS